MTSESGALAAKWWHKLRPNPNHSDPRRRAGDRAALARLRRCATVMEAAAEPATHALLRKLDAGPARLECAALIAGVLAHVRKDVAGRVARQVGPRDGHAAMSDLRFRRLMQAETPDEQLVVFRRLVALADRTLNVADLAGSLWDWSEQRRLGWIYEYHNAPRPTATPASEDDIP